MKTGADFPDSEPEFDPGDPSAWIAWFTADFRRRRPDGDSLEYLKALAESDPGRARFAEVLFTGGKADAVALFHSAVGRPGTREDQVAELAPEGIEIGEVSPAVRAVLGLLAREGPSSQPATPPPSGQKKSPEGSPPGSPASGLDF